MAEIEECLSDFLSEIKPKSEVRKVHITECYGKIASEDIYAPMMVPHFPKSAMDGYAVFSGDLSACDKEHPVKFKVVAEICAGDCKDVSYEKNTAVRIMTGAMVPEGYDAVIRQEDTDYGMDYVEIYSSAKPYMNYCRVGEDIQEGELVVPKNTRITSVHAGLLSSLGIEWINVYEDLKAAIISTGSEITEIGTPLSGGKIYNSIAYVLLGAITREGFCVTSHTSCVDEKEALKAHIEEKINEADVLITTGGVSVGVKDLIPYVMEELGAKQIFYRANIQPGTPTMGWIYKDKPVLCLSGNPYAAIANFEIYFWEIAAKMMHNDFYRPKICKAVLKSEYTKVNRLRRFIRANCVDGSVTIPSDNHASSVIRNMTECNCFIDLKAGDKVSVGDMVTVRFIRSI